MKGVIVVALCLIAVSCASASAPFSEREYQFLFTKWVAQWSRAYENESFFHKYNTFKSNLDFIVRHNALNRSYTLEMNQFGDLTNSEFAASQCGFRRPESSRPAERIVLPPGRRMDDSIDWTAKGAVTPIKDQGQCGSCWAFSAVGAIEGAGAISSGKLIAGSEQQLVDCSGSEGNYGCNGGLMDSAFEWAVKNKGIASEGDYPYKARDGQCKTGIPNSISVSAYKDVTHGDEAELKKAVSLGPVSIAVEADQSVFQFYHDGVLDDPSCGQQLNHGVLITGYGSTASGQPYWMVKNSWGASWGKAGYIWMVRDQNECGLALMASYVIS